MPFNPSLDIVAVVVATLAAFAVGSLWYGLLFRKRWTRLSGIDPKPPTGMMRVRTMALGLLGTALTAWVFAWITEAVAAAGGDEYGISVALQGAFWSWLGFFLPVTAGAAIWEGKSWTLVAINGGHALLSLAAMAVVLGIWPR